MSQEKICMVYMTAKDKEEAQNIGKELVKERLAACANIIDGMSSFYWWENEIQDDSETVLIVKTKESLVEKLTEKVKSIHRYTVPCIVALPIIGGNAEYLDWVRRETADKS